jgi:O-antigen ligase
MLSNKIRIIINFLILLTPTLINLFKHAGSVILSLLVFFAIIVFFTTKQAAFSRHEKLIMSSFAGYFLVCLIMSVAHNFFNQGSILQWEVDHELRMLAFAPIYYLFTKIKPKEWIFWCAILSAAILSGLYAFYVALGTHFSLRVIGPYNACLYGYLSITLAFMSLSGYRYFYEKDRKLGILPLLAFACGLLAAFLSGTRGSILAVPFLLILFLIQIYKYSKKLNLKQVIVSLCAIFIAFIFLFPSSFMLKRFNKAFDDVKYCIDNYDCVDCFKKNQAARMRMWVQSLIILKDHYLFGVGPKGWQERVKERVNKKEIAPGIERFQSPHNMYLAMMTSYGILGFIMLLLIFLLPLFSFSHAIKTNRDNPIIIGIAFSGLSLIFSFMLCSLTGTLFNRNILISFYVIMLAATLSIMRPSINQKTSDGL